MDSCEPQNKTIGLWMSDKKSQKHNWKEFIKACTSHGYNLVRVSNACIKLSD